MSFFIAKRGRGKQHGQGSQSGGERQEHGEGHKQDGQGEPMQGRKCHILEYNIFRRDIVIKSVEHRLPIQKVGSWNPGRAKAMTYKIETSQPNLMLGIKG